MTKEEIDAALEVANDLKIKLNRLIEDMSETIENCEAAKRSTEYAEGVTRGRIMERARVTEILKVTYMDLNDWLLAESPNGFMDEKKYSADDVQRNVCNAIQGFMEVLDKVMDRINRK